jgi:hypothetical protein
MTEVSTAAMASWLLHHVEWLRHHRAGHEAVEEITTAVYEVCRVIDRPNNRSTFAIGPCPEFECVGEVRVFIPAREDRPAFMVCAACGARWDSVQFLNAGKRIVATQQQRIAPFIDSAAAAAALGVSDRTIRRWCVQGLLTNRGTSARIMLDLMQVDELKASNEPA